MTYDYKMLHKKFFINNRVNISEFYINFIYSMLAIVDNL